MKAIYRMLVSKECVAVLIELYKKCYHVVTVSYVGSKAMSICGGLRKQHDPGGDYTQILTLIRLDCGQI